MSIVLVVCIWYLINNAIIASFLKNAAYAKGYDDNCHAWAVSFWLGLPGWIYVASLPDLVQRKNQEAIINLLSKGNVEVNKDELPDL